MKTSLNWLARHLSYDCDDWFTIINNINIILVKHGIEVEEFLLHQVLVKCKIIDKKLIYERKQIHLYKIEFDTEVCDTFNLFDITQVVSADNTINIGDYVLLILPNTKLQNDIIIQKVKIYDYDSHGMFAGEKDIDFFSFNPVLQPKTDAVYKVDKTITQQLFLLQNSDIIIDISVSSNRSDLMSVHGIARELAYAGLGTLLIIPQTQYKINNWDLNVESIIDIRFMNIDIKSYKWVDEITPYLELIGKVSNNVLQRLNDWILLDIGYPTAIYDYNYFDNTNIIVDHAAEKQQYKSISGDIYKTSGNEILISNKKEVLAIAGIYNIVGYNEYTTNIVIEAAKIIPKYLDLCSGYRTISEKLFYLGCDFNFDIVNYISNLLATNINLYSKWSTIDNKVITCTANELVTIFEYNIGIKTNIKILLDALFNNGFNIIVSIIGVFFDNSYNYNITRNITNQAELEIQIPSWRHDIKTVIHLCEEIVRITDIVDFYKIYQVPKYNFDYKVNESLISKGYIEIINDVFSNNGEIELINSLDKSFLRTNLTDKLIAKARNNFNNGAWNIKYFESGIVFKNNKEYQMIALVCSGKTPRKWYKKSEVISFFYFKEDLNAAFIKPEEFLYEESNNDYISIQYYNNGYIGITKDLIYVAEFIVSNTNKYRIISEINNTQYLDVALEFLEPKKWNLIAKDLQIFDNNKLSINSHIVTLNIFDIYENGKKIAFTIYYDNSIQDFKNIISNYIKQHVPYAIIR